MKKSFLKSAIIVFLTLFIATAFVMDFKTIFLSVELTTYILYAVTFVLLGILFVDLKSLKTGFSVLKIKRSDMNKAPEKIYLFAKVNNKMELDQCEIKDITKGDGMLYMFFSRFKERYSKAEIRTYLTTQKNQLRNLSDESTKASNWIYLIAVVSTVTAFIYDSHMKGILAVSMTIAIANMVALRKIKENLNYMETMLTVFESICEDILEFRNARYIMYKVKDLLLISDEEVEINTMEAKKMMETSRKVNISHKTEDRKSRAVSLGSLSNNKTNASNKKRNIA